MHNGAPTALLRPLFREKAIIPIKDAGVVQQEIQWHALWHSKNLRDTGKGLEVQWSYLCVWMKLYIVGYKQGLNLFSLCQYLA